MKQEREVSVEGTVYRVVISDEQETLLAARVAGRVPVGLLHEEGEQDLGAAHFLVETLETVDERYLERVVRRELGLPWVIGESERLILREFAMGDLEQVVREPEDGDGDRVFYTPDRLEAYIRGQYGFYEYGLWAVVRKADGRLMGKAGITGCHVRDGNMPGEPEEWMELGYHIFTPYRRQGYAEEACRIILDYAEQEYGCPVCAYVETGNAASAALLEKLGFQKMTEKIPESCAKLKVHGSILRESESTEQRCTESDVPQYRYVRNC
ncbi:MAG: GNAT family N-acetyltransferase [Eubacteriales bacterium]|nr:GNAT family N-acetyltransferase [Eubacteriales bacterium]